MASRLILSYIACGKSCAGKITLLSPAKLNLYLNVVGKYKDGFHKIESIVERISLFDYITISPRRGSSISITCNVKRLANKDNLCVRAASLIRKRCNLKCGFDISLKKCIPAGSGLGGASSNAASVIIGINRLLKLGLSRRRLYSLGKTIGSDVNFFLSESPYALMEGRGERITPFPGKTFYHYVVWPGVSLATSSVYRACEVGLTKFFSNANILKYAVKHGDTVLLRNNNFNALERCALSLCGQIGKVKQRLQTYSMDSRVTGSGSAVYTILERAQAVKKINLPRKWTAFTAQTF